MKLFQVGVGTDRWLVRALEAEDVMLKVRRHIERLFAGGAPGTTTGPGSGCAGCGPPHRHVGALGEVSYVQPKE